ncbi:MAG: hypothetical protein GC179_24825 [Anaerolineaceae bacterium]|nr:hypothetical protein [Anaerolineaceae bacterium]
MFCAAIPMSVSVGVALAGKQTERNLQAQGRGEKLTSNQVPIGKLTAGVTGGLVICSVVYHLVIMPHTGAII